MTLHQTAPGQPSPQDLPEPASAPHPSLRLRPILIVDDDPFVRGALGRQLKRMGFPVTDAESGAAALEYAGRATADLVILDLRMPGLNGFETCRRLKGMRGWEDVPVLILTGDQDEADYRAAIDSGADDFLTKPAVFQELMLRIHSLLRIKRFMADLRESVATIEAQRKVILQAHAIRDKLQAFLLHDLKNPISNILLQAEMNLELEADRRSAGWGQVLDNGERLMRLVTGWLDFLHSEQAGLEPRKDLVELQPFLADVLGHHEVWFQVRQLEAHVDIEAGLTGVRMDPLIMERVIGNLLENCIRYSPQGGEIRLRAFRTPARELRLEISDQGPGVPEAMRSTLFDMYVQLEAASSTLSARESRGLGLAFCRMAVEAHGGRIWVEDHEAGGSRFVIQLPAEVPDADSR